MRERPLKVEIKCHYRAELDNRLNVYSIKFRKVAGRLKLTFTGGVDRKGSCSVVVDDILDLLPDYNVDDTSLRIHSITQYFIRYNIAYTMRKTHAHHMGVVEDFGVRLDGYDTKTKNFTKYQIVWFFKDGEHVVDEYTGNPLEFEAEYGQARKMVEGLTL